jgi:hypothetical protein
VPSVVVSVVEALLILLVLGADQLRARRPRAATGPGAAPSPAVAVEGA